MSKKNEPEEKSEPAEEEQPKKRGKLGGDPIVILSN